MPSDDVSPDRTDMRSSDGNRDPTAREGSGEDGPSHARPPVIPDRYAPLQLVDGAVVIYDRESSDAWIESSYAIPLGDAERVE